MSLTQKTLHKTIKIIFNLKLKIIINTSLKSEVETRIIFKNKLIFIDFLINRYKN